MAAIQKAVDVFPAAAVMPKRKLVEADDHSPAFASPARALQETLASRFEALEPEADKWPGWLSVTALVGGAAASWGALIGSIALLHG